MTMIVMSIARRSAVVFVVATAVCSCGDSGSMISKRSGLAQTGYALFAYHDLSVENHAQVTGALGVRDAKSSSSPELVVGPHAAVSGDLQADTIKIESHASVTGAVSGNGFTIHKTASLSQLPTSPLSIPLTDVTPSIPAALPGTQDITLASGETLTLASGAYRAIDIRSGASTTLSLTGGLYQLQSLALGPHSHLVCLTACELRIAGSLSAANHSSIGPGAGGAAGAVLITVGASVVADLGQHVTFTGRLIAKQGSIEVGGHAVVRGQLIAATITLRPHAKAVVESPFGAAGDAGVTVDAGVPDLPRSDAPRPDLPLHDAPRADLPRPDAPAPDLATPDAPRPDTAIPDTLSCTSIGSAGGSVTSSDGKAILEVPASALSSAVCFRILPASSPPSGVIGSSYSVEPAGTTFSTPATMRLLYDPNSLGGVAEATLALAKVSGSAWQIVAGSSVDAGNDRVSAAVGETGSFGIVPSVCGDGVVSGTEACDGSVPPGATCQSLGFVGGLLACTACAVDTSGCISCLPTTCAALGKNCGFVPDGCGGTLDCGTCAAPQSCGGGGVANVCGCTPSTCAALGATCGSIADGCGGTLACGSCTLPETCVANHCVCTPTTCAVQLASCGTIPDGCGGSLDCGTCLAPATCGGGGVPNTCGCTPTTCAALGATCGSVPDGCGGSLDCGTCALPQTCGGGGTANQCGCTPTTCAAQGKDCGTISDGCGGTLDCGSCGAGLLCGWGGIPNVCGAGIPPDPASIAPPADTSVATSVHKSTAFLYSGSTPIQLGVAPGAIDPVRAAVVRGRVLNEQGNPLPGVTVSIFQHPELGSTISRSDGRFDLAVNGGGRLTVSYEAPGLLPVHREARVRWQDYTVLDDVMMIALDPQVTTVNSSSPVLQVARGSAIADASGSRRATLLFPSGTTASVRTSGGQSQPLSTFHVRATEYTVGELGPKRMPAELPPSVAYTYAVELSVDEAAGATVEFSTPVAFYLENFLGFEAGTAVPVGYYDRQRAIWVPSLSGRVIKILSVTGGMVDLDVDGSGNPATPSALLALGITDEERTTLAGIYSQGQSLWRATVTHFTPLDLNWSWSDDDAEPNVPDPKVDTPKKKDCKEPGSIIECRNQVLRHEVPIAGTSLSLSYSSGRVPGRTTPLTIYLSQGSLPTALKTIDLEVSVAGRVFKQSFAPALNLTHKFHWDGLDVYGRKMEGLQRATIRVGYISPSFYELVAMFGGFASVGSAGMTSWIQTRADRERWVTKEVRLGVWNGQTARLGGWGIDAHHSYDPLGQRLHLGNGQIRDRSDRTLRVVEPQGSQYSGNDTAWGVAAGPDGSVYIARGDYHTHVVEKIARDGTKTRVAGAGPPGFSGDGGPAASAQLNYPWSLALDAQGNLFIGDHGNKRVRRVGRDGFITTVAGNGTYGLAGDGGLATFASVASPRGIAVDRAGNLYIASQSCHRVRRVAPNGLIETYAGISTGCDYWLNPGGFSGDGGPATSAALRSPADVAVDDEGNLFIADMGNNRIRRVRADGIISTWAGDGTSGFSGDGGPAINARFSSPTGVSLDSRGTLYVADMNNMRVRAIGSDGLISTFGGGSESPGWIGSVPASIDGWPATRPMIYWAYHVAADPEGGVFIAPDSGLAYPVHRIAPTLPRYSGSSIAVPSDDGNYLYLFDSDGRHLSTKNSITGATVMSFGYDARGELATITDGDGKVTTIVRDATGSPTGIVSPFGQTTTLSVGADGFLAEVANPAGDTSRFTYAPGGLLETQADPRGGVHRFTYDSDGLLATDEDPTGARTTISRTDPTSTTFSVARVTAEGRSTTYETESIVGGSETWRNVFPNGLSSNAQFGNDATSSTAFADGTVFTEKERQDPRWFMAAPFVNATSTRVPSGTTRTTGATRSVSTLAGDPLSISSKTDTLTVNGKTSYSTYTGWNRRFTTTSAAGRTSTTDIDPQGRVTNQIAPGLAPVAYQYDALGRLVTVTQGIAPDTRITSMTYNAQGYLATVTDPLYRIVSFSYDLAGRVTEQHMPGGRTVLMGYDANGNLSSITPPGRTAHLFGFTPVDETASYTPPDLGLGSPTTSYEYNLDRQLAKVTRPDGQTIVMGYDGAGRLSTVTTPTGVKTYTYSPTTGTLSTIAAPGGVGLSYTWDGSLPTGTTWSGPVAGSVTRTYNTDFDVASISVAGTSFGFTRDNDRLLTGAGAMTIARDATTGFVTGTTLGGVTTGRTYSSFGELATTRARAGSTPLFATSFTRDALGRITELVETIEGVTTTWGYDYNVAGQLYRVRENGLQVAEYQYDLNGNRLSATDELGVSTSGVYDAQDRLSTYGSASYSYTLNGELQSKTMPGVGTTTFSYDVLGNLRGATLADGTAIEYVIDGENRRVGKKVGGALVQGWLWDGELRVVAELDGAGAVVGRFVYAEGVNVPEYMIKGGVTYRIITDHLGSPRLVVDVATGAVAQRMDFDEWGRVTSDSNAGFQPFGFAGGLYDQHTKLVRFGARDYDPEVGRWTSKDSIRFAPDEALYVYAGGDPVNAVDLTGAAWWSPLFYPQPITPEQHKYRNLLNRCPKRRPTPGAAACGENSWKVDERDSTKLYSPTGYECKYDENGNFIQGGTYNFVPNKWIVPKWIPDPSHTVLDWFPHFLYGDDYYPTTNLR